MSLLSHQLELLAPARDADIGIEAVNHGADAVYIGGPAFGARASAGNDVADIERLARHAHRFGARIFVTHNTILCDDELEAARRMAWDVYRAGADADVLIIQDMGPLEPSPRPRAAAGAARRGLMVPRFALPREIPGACALLRPGAELASRLRALRSNNCAEHETKTARALVAGAAQIGPTGQHLPRQRPSAAHPAHRSLGTGEAHIARSHAALR